MIKIDYPVYHPKTKEANGKEWICDEARKKWVLLTPEEWVRQNFLQYLVQVMHYPVSLIAIEKEIFLGDVKKRFDIVVYNKKHTPWMIVECKEMKTALDKKVLDQALRYNITLQVPYIVITNGSYCHAFECGSSLLKQINHLPALENEQ